MRIHKQTDADRRSFSLNLAHTQVVTAEASTHKSVQFISSLFLNFVNNEEDTDSCSNPADVCCSRLWAGKYHHHCQRHNNNRWQCHSDANRCSEYSPGEHDVGSTHWSPGDIVPVKHLKFCQTG